MARLSIAWLLGLTTTVIGLLAFYVVYSMLHDCKLDSLVLGGFATILAALVWHGVVALKNKHSPSADEK